MVYTKNGFWIYIAKTLAANRYCATSPILISPPPVHGRERLKLRCTLNLLWKRRRPDGTRLPRVKVKSRRTVWLNPPLPPRINDREIIYNARHSPRDATVTIHISYRQRGATGLGKCNFSSKIVR